MYVESADGRSRRLDYARIHRSRPLARPAAAWHRRVARTLGLVVLVVAILSLVLARGVQGRVETQYDTVVVRPGDTLWSIAETHYPAQDPRLKLEEIERVNRLGSPVVQPGQRLRIPVS